MSVSRVIALFFWFLIFSPQMVKADPLFQIHLYSDIIEAEKLTTQLRTWLALKAGQVEMGDVIDGKPYYHFHLPEKRITEFYKYINRFGQFTVTKFAHPRSSPPLRKRFILTLHPEAEFSPRKYQLNKLPQRTDIKTDYSHDVIVDVTPYVRPDFNFSDFMGSHWKLNNPGSPRLQYFAEVPTESLSVVFEKLQSIGAIDVLALKNYSSENLKQRVLIKFVRIDVAVESLWEVKNLKLDIVRKPAAVESAIDALQLKPDAPIQIDANFRFSGSYLPYNNGKAFSVYHSHLETLINSWVVDIESVDYQGAPEVLDFRSYSLLLGKRFTWDQHRLDFLAGLRRLRVGVPDSDLYDVGVRYGFSDVRILDLALDWTGWFRSGKSIETQIDYFPAATNALIKNIGAYSFKLNVVLPISQKLSLISGIYSHVFEFDAFGGPGKESTGIRNRTFIGEIGFSYKF